MVLPRAVQSAALRLDGMLSSTSRGTICLNMYVWVGNESNAETSVDFAGV